MSSPVHKPQVKSTRVGPARSVCDDERVPLDMTEGVVAASSPPHPLPRDGWLPHMSGVTRGSSRSAPITTEGDEIKVYPPLKAPQRIRRNTRAEPQGNSKS